MFENMVRSSAMPVVIELINALEHALGVVEEKLAIDANGEDDVLRLAAKLQLHAIAAWRPALDDLKDRLDTSHRNAHGTALPVRRGS